MNELSDQRLLRDYAKGHSDAAFAELVRRHVDLVYSAALRMVCEAHSAKDVTQTVFMALAQNAPQLTNHPVLSGWLHCTARNLAAKAVRTDSRRRAREQEAAAMNELLAHESDANWEHIAPHLDAALGELSEADRDALMLRYFERKSAREMAQTLGISDEAAQKRVTRAVERLREFFAKHGVTVGASGLVVIISANAVQAAPAGLAITISTAAALAGTTLITTTTATATKAIAMTTLQKSLVTVTLVAAVGTGIHQARQSSTLRTEVQSLQRQQASLSEQNQQLAGERDDATRQLAALRAENERANGNAELLRLRGEVGALRKQNQSLAQANGNLPKAHETQTLNKGFGTLGEYLALEKVSDAGNSTAEALLQTFVWAMREGKAERLEQIGAPFGGQGKPGDVVGEVPESEAAIFKTVQNVFTNSVGFRLSSKRASDGQKYEVRLDADPLPDRQDEFMKNINLSFFLEQKADRWSFGNPVEESAPKSK